MEVNLFPTCVPGAKKLCGDDVIFRNCETISNLESCDAVKFKISKFPPRRFFSLFLVFPKTVSQEIIVWKRIKRYYVIHLRLSRCLVIMTIHWLSRFYEKKVAGSICVCTVEIRRI